MRGEKDVYARGVGYGLGFGVLVDPTFSFCTLSLGSYGLGWGLWYFVLRRSSRGTGRPHAHPVTGALNIRQRFTNMVSQAVVDSAADQAPTVKGYSIVL
jgi:hypothetical protein